MRIERVNPKKLESVVIPERLVNFFKQVDNDIKSGSEYTKVESDDLIQNDFAYGGLTEEGKDSYSFTYFPNKVDKYTWEFSLNIKQIDQIAKGNLTKLDLWSCKQDGCQSKFMNKEGRCFYHDYYDDGKPSPSQKTPEEIWQIQQEKKKWLEAYLQNLK